jgi:hypothetical protein
MGAPVNNPLTPVVLAAIGQFIAKSTPADLAHLVLHGLLQGALRSGSLVGVNATAIGERGVQLLLDAANELQRIVERSLQREQLTLVVTDPGDDRG